MSNKKKSLIEKIIHHAKTGTLVATSFRFISNQIHQFIDLYIFVKRSICRIVHLTVNIYLFIINRVNNLSNTIHRLLLFTYPNWLYLTSHYLYICSAIIAIVLVTHDLLFFRRKNSKSMPHVNVADSSVEVIIVNWNGASLLRQCLPSVVAAAVKSQTPTSVTIVDNGSDDDSIEWTMTNWPSVRIISLPVNYGFGEGNNIAVSKSNADIIILLNNDMLVDNNFIDPLIQALKAPGTFAAASQIMMRSEVRREETGLTTGTFSVGRFNVMHASITPLIDLDDVVPVFWAGGGAMAVHRRSFNMLGGFQKLYAPFYWEDADLSYRAWTLGLRSVMVPQSRVLHLHRSTTSRFSETFVKRIVRRNEYLFTWSNVDNWRWMSEHLLMLPIHVVRDAKQAGIIVAFGSFFTALLRLPAVFVLRRKTNINRRLSDQEIMVQFFK